MTGLPWHHSYDDDPPAGSFCLLRAERGPAVGSKEFVDRMRAVGDTLRRAGVGAVFLAHGTFVGRELFGLASGIDQLFPGTGERLGQAVKQLVDALTGDAGNYPPDYARLFETGMHAEGELPIAVRLFHWSGENHHLARADAAVRLIDALLKLDLPPDRRILLWGHSHAGNVFALATHLLSGDRARVRRLFRAARPYYRWPLFRRPDVPHWVHVRKLLRKATTNLLRDRLDIVTLGTPVRYAWHAAGCTRLLHFIHHTPDESLPPWRAAFPPSAEAILGGHRGDFAQQLGIAGTNVMPNLLAWRTWLADRRLSRLLQPGLRARDVWQYLAAGRRVPDDGQTLLVDYRQQPGPITQHLAGHAIYTRREWLLFHAEEAARRLYGS